MNSLRGFVLVSIAFVTVLSIGNATDLVGNSNNSTKFDAPRIYDPPPREHLLDTRKCYDRIADKNDSTINCHGGKFVKTKAFFQPCNRHSHCYQSREPSEWCVLPWGFRWSHWGCHCDRKIGSCVIERWDTVAQALQWGYCTPKPEHQCERIPTRRVDAYWTRQKKETDEKASRNSTV